MRHLKIRFFFKGAPRKCFPGPRCASRRAWQRVCIRIGLRAYLSVRRTAIASSRSRDSCRYSGRELRHLPACIKT